MTLTGKRDVVLPLRGYLSDLGVKKKRRLTLEGLSLCRRVEKNVVSPLGEFSEKTNIQTDKQTDKQTNKQTNKKTFSKILCGGLSSNLLRMWWTQ